MKPSENTMEIFLQPGEFYFAEAPLYIRTLLGSCIAITMWHPQRLIGGMCHYMLPSRQAIRDQLNGKYADEAMLLFRDQARQHNTRLQDYQIKLFGGGTMFARRHHRAHGIDIANNNVAVAHRLLAHYGLTLSAQDLGHHGYRNIIFDLSTGDVWVKHRDLVEQ
jgi:chemotaxis protein CheD